MSAGNPNQDNSQDMQTELERTMHEAEAAVDSVGDQAQSTKGEGADAQAPDASESAEELARLQGEVDALKDKWLRAVADLDNHKKRVRRELDEATMRATQDLLQSFLPTVDNLERALEAAGVGPDGDVPEGSDRLLQLIKGIQMVRNEFMGALQKHGIEPVPSVGQPFDPALHDALQQIDSPDHAPGIVIREFEKGYRKGDRLLRPARVIVAGGGSTGGDGEARGEAE